MAIRRFLTDRHSHGRLSEVSGAGFQGCCLRVLHVVPVKMSCLIILFLLSCLSSCDEATVYHKYQAIPDNAGWHREDSLFFYFPQNLLPMEYALEIGVRNTCMYPYKDIWLAVTEVKGDSVWESTTDTLHLYLTDEEGRWNREGSVGGYYQSTFVCDRPLVVAADSVGRGMCVVHIMRDNPLQGISDVGIRLLKK